MEACTAVVDRRQLAQQAPNPMVLVPGGITILQISQSRYCTAGLHSDFGKGSHVTTPNRYHFRGRIIEFVQSLLSTLVVEDEMIVPNLDAITVMTVYTTSGPFAGWAQIVEEYNSPCVPGLMSDLVQDRHTCTRTV